MLTGLFAGAAAALVLALIFVTRPRLAYRAAHLFEHVGRGRGDAAARLFLVFAIAGGILGVVARL
jgi:hypothetical protein